MRGGGANWQNADVIFLRGRGHIAGMPTVADKRGVGVKNLRKFADALNGWSPMASSTKVHSFLKQCLHNL